MVVPASIVGLAVRRGGRGRRQTKFNSNASDSSSIRRSSRNKP